MKGSKLVPGLLKSKGGNNNNPAENEETKKKKKMDTEFLEKTEVLVRVYVLNATNLPQMDADSASDPYLKIILGNKTIDVNKLKKKKKYYYYL